MNDNAPESERWVPVKFDPSLSGPSTVQGGDKPGAEFFAKNAKNSPALDRARREAEAVIADRFNRIS